MRKDNTQKNSWIKDALSENGVPSSKRLLGSLIILVCLMCIVFFAIKEGATNNVKDLLDTAFIVAAGLLGISSITGIWSSKYSGRGGSGYGYEETNYSSRYNYNGQSNYYQGYQQTSYMGAPTIPNYNEVDYSTYSARNSADYVDYSNRED